MDDLKLDNVQQQWDTFLTSAIAWAPKIITAVISAFLIYLVGSWMIRMIKRLVEKAFKRRNMEPSLQLFFIKYYQLGT
ncbi:mechanosensitive ion channel family protein [Chryseobacterium proteolyticum]|uniref:mechanosensitive ion channel family protein n=1 Tax=Chryseobacterium proteolyticum TaxID=118127 RepID=UPI0039834AE8